jgi:hypothetical protein
LGCPHHGPRRHSQRAVDLKASSSAAKTRARSHTATARSTRSRTALRCVFTDVGEQARDPRPADFDELGDLAGQLDAG